MARASSKPAGETLHQKSEIVNFMPLFITCVESDVTLGEICNTLRGVWGEYIAQGF